MQHFFRSQTNPDLHYVVKSWANKAELLASITSETCSKAENKRHHQPGIRDRTLFNKMQVDWPWKVIYQNLCDTVWCVRFLLCISSCPFPPMYSLLKPRWLCELKGRHLTLLLLIQGCIVSSRSKSDSHYVLLECVWTLWHTVFPGSNSLLAPSFRKWESLTSWRRLESRQLFLAVASGQ